MRVYDYYYEHHVMDTQYPDDYLDNTPFRADEIQLEKSPGIIFNGEVVTLSQKNR
jgi:hypothetical protein